jgi:hypothetical protein
MGSLWGPSLPGTRTGRGHFLPHPMGRNSPQLRGDVVRNSQSSPSSATIPVPSLIPCRSDWSGIAKGRVGLRNEWPSFSGSMRRAFRAGRGESMPQPGNRWRRSKLRWLAETAQTSAGDHRVRGGVQPRSDTQGLRGNTFSGSDQPKARTTRRVTG